jgi:hypothetical protein
VVGGIAKNSKAILEQSSGLEQTPLAFNCSQLLKRSEVVWVSFWSCLVAILALRGTSWRSPRKRPRVLCTEQAPTAVAHASRKLMKIGYAVVDGCTHHESARKRPSFEKFSIGKLKDKVPGTTSNVILAFDATKM